MCYYVFPTFLHRGTLPSCLQTLATEALEAVITTVADATAGGESRHLAQPFKITVVKTPVYAVYPLIFLQVCNDNAAVRLDLMDEAHAHVNIYLGECVSPEALKCTCTIAVASRSTADAT